MYGAVALDNKELLTMNPKKTGDASPGTCDTNHGTDTKVSTTGQKNFCTRCRSIDPIEKNHDFHVFVDRLGRGWRCAIPYQCDHAIIHDGSIYSCRILTSILNSQDREKGTTVSEVCHAVQCGKEVVILGRS